MKLLEAETRTNRQLAELRDFADSVEVAMDTATTAAAVAGTAPGHSVEGT